LLFRKEIREIKWVLHAFNVEVSRIQDSSTEKPLAAMKFQFWKDQVEAIFQVATISLNYLKGRPTNQPVAQALAYMLNHVPFSKMWFKKLVLERVNA
jgi:phytoene/squalene synthetase